MEEDPLDEQERRQLFYELKRRSSWTAWNRILGFFKEWADIHKRSLQIASAKGFESKTSMPESDYVMILEDLAHCDTAVSRLHAGDKRVFRCGPMGEFKKAGSRMLSYTIRLLGYVDSGDNGIQFDTTPLWDEFAIATDKLGTAWGECGPSILEPDDINNRGKPSHKLDIPANDWFRNTRPPLDRFPSDLPEVPNPSENILASTGTYLKCSGIWEPVEVPPRTFASLFRSVPPKGPFPIIGAMAYLHGGTPAPRKVFEYTHGRARGDMVTWRLLWRDDRYEDGTIPEEEKGYKFQEDFVFPYPDALAPKPAAKTPPSQPADSLIILESGQPTPTAGRWLLEGSLQISVQLAEGEILPLHEGRKVHWVLAAT
jgi:hypothetical protein